MVEEQILTTVDENAETSVRRVSAQVEINKNVVWRTLHQQILYPYHIQRVQALTNSDCQRRLPFCRWFLGKCAEYSNFAPNVLFTEEAGLSRDGIFNLRNTHVWSDVKPHAIVESRHQQSSSLNVLFGVVGDGLIGQLSYHNA